MAKYNKYSMEELIELLNLKDKDLKNKKLGLYWDRERDPEKVVTECETKLPILNKIKSKCIKTKNDNSTPNILIEGDNYHALQVLNYTHKGKINVIYIDPPYNTGKDKWIYNDCYIDSNDGFRHSKWLNMMEKRLTLAKDLLSKDGVIFISIDDNEQYNLRLLCNKIFGYKNLLSVHNIQVRYENKSLNEKKDFQELLEYVLIYKKGDEKIKFNKPKEDYSLNNFNYSIKHKSKPTKTVIENGRKIDIWDKENFKIEKLAKGNINLFKETWVSGSIYSGTGHGSMYKRTIEKRFKEDGASCLYKIYGIGKDGLGYRYFANPINAKNKRGRMYTKVPLEILEEIKKGGVVIKENPIINFYDYSADFGNISHEGGVSFNSGKKPVKMLKQFLNYIPSKEIVVLDFFAGSGTTGHAVLELNDDDGGNRQFILCTNNEFGDNEMKEVSKKYNIKISDILKERKLRSVKYQQWEDEFGIASAKTYPRMYNVINGYSKVGGLGSNLEYFKTDFINKVSDRSQLKYNLTQKCGQMLCLKESIFKEYSSKKDFDIFISNDDKRFLCIYFNVINNSFNDFIKILKDIKGEKIIYIFSEDGLIDDKIFKSVKNKRVVPIPKRILEIYNKIIRDSKKR